MKNVNLIFLSSNNISEENIFILFSIQKTCLLNLSRLFIRDTYSIGETSPEIKNL